MTKRISKITALVLVTVLVCISSLTVSAANVKLQLFFAPNILNDVTGDLTVDVKLKNFNTAVHSSYGDICGFSFEFQYDKENFDIKLTDNGEVAIDVDETTLIKSTDDIETEYKDGNVVCTYLDSTLKNNLIGNDGTLFRFTIVSKNPIKFWNSNDKYELKFVPGSIAVVTYNLPKLSVANFYNTEGIDISYGSYNYPPSLQTPSVDKTLVFTEGDNIVKVDDFTLETDAKPYKKDEMWMLPVRYLSENIGMNIEWNGDMMIAESRAEFKTLVIQENTKKIYINAKQYVPQTPMETIDGRIYISEDVISELYEGAIITGDASSVTVYVP